MSAKEAVLERVGSHYVTIDHHPDPTFGFSKEQVFGYFSAKWRGQSVQVEMQCDRYAHSSGMSEWRVWVQAARYYDSERNGGRGEGTTGTARSALGELCAPLMEEWLTSDEYTPSFQRAAADAILRMFEDRYSAHYRVPEALATFNDRLTPETLDALTETLDAFNAYTAAKEHAYKVARGEVEHA